MGMQPGQASSTQPATQGKSSSSGSQPAGGMSNFMQLIQGMLSSAGGGIQSGQGASSGSQRSFQDPVGMFNPGQSPLAQGFHGAQGDTNNPNTGGAGFGALQNPSTSQGGGGAPNPYADWNKYLSPTQQINSAGVAGGSPFQAPTPGGDWGSSNR